MTGRYENYRIIVVSMGERPELEWMREERRGWIKWVKIERAVSSVGRAASIVTGSNKYNNNHNKYASTRNDNGKTTTFCMECIYYSMVATSIIACTSGRNNNVAN